MFCLVFVNDEDIYIWVVVEVLSVGMEEVIGEMCW